MNSIRNMKKIILALMLVMTGFVSAFAGNEAEIKFDELTRNLGTFNENDGVKTVKFNFTNVGTAPLVIHQAVASCGCTIPSYDKKPIAPGQKGSITVKYNGKGKYPGYFKKTITVRTNGKVEMTRLYIEGTMNEAGK